MGFRVLFDGEKTEKSHSHGLENSNASSCPSQHRGQVAASGDDGLCKARLCRNQQGGGPARTEQTRGHSHTPGEKPNGAAKPGRPAQPEHEVPTWPWPWRVDSRKRGLPPTPTDFGGKDHQARSSLTPKFRIGSLLPSTSLGQCRAIVICTQRPHGWEKRAWCRSPVGHHRRVASHLQRPRAVVRRGRPLGGLNRGRKRWWRRERRPHGSPESRQSVLMELRMSVGLGTWDASKMLGDSGS